MNDTKTTNGLNGVAHARPPRSRTPRKRKPAPKAPELAAAESPAVVVEQPPPPPVVETPPEPEPVPIEVKAEPVPEPSPAPVQETKAPTPPEPEPAATAPATSTPEAPPVIWYRPIEQPSFPVADALRQMPSSVIYAPDVDLRPMKGLGFDLRAWGYGQIVLMRLAEARSVRLADGRVEECPKGEAIIVPVVTDLEAIIPAMQEHPDVAIELEFAPIGLELSPDGTVRVRFAVLPPKPTEIPRDALWGAKRDA